MEHSTPQIYTEFLPISRADMEARGWEQLDFVVVGGDAYVDHPSFGTAIISRDVYKRQGRLLNDQIVEADAGGVVVVEDDELAIDRAVDIRFHGKVSGAVAGCHKSGAGVLFLNAAQAAVRYHFDCLVFNFDRIHCEPVSYTHLPR